MTYSSAPPGLFGKLPSEGDFVTRALPWSFTEPWDHWMQQGMATAHATLGERWLALYMSCPVWRFLLGPGVCGNSAWIGLWFVSVDRVGRQFPLTVACPLPAMPVALDALILMNDWLLALEQTALTALDPRTRADDLAYQLAQLAPPHSLPTHNGTEVTVPARYRQEEPEPWPPQGRLPGDGAGHTVWYCDGTDEITPRLLVARGLPDAGQFRHFIEQPDATSTGGNTDQHTGHDNGQNGAQ